MSSALMAQGPAVQVTADSLSVVTWDGAYEDSQRIAYFRPFTKETGIPIAAQAYNGTLKAARSAIKKSGEVDVIDVSSGVLAKLCQENLLNPIDKSDLVAKAPSRPATPGDPEETASTGPEADFIDGGISSCGVASVAWAATVVFDADKFGSKAPSKAADFFDLDRFPGRRALPKTAPYTLELALLGDGVGPKDVYTTLATPEGQARAFAALDKIRSQIVWWSKPATPLRLLKQGKASMGIAYTGRIFRNAVEAPGKIGIVWDGQIYDLDHWAIPKTSKRKKEAAEFVAFASQPERLAAHAALTAYGPARKSAVALVDTHPVVGVKMQRFLPTAPEHFENALHFDQAWWDSHGEEIEKRFTAWRNGRPAPETKAKDESAD